MADLSRAVEIVFNGVDSVSGTLRTMGSNIDKFGDSLQDIGQPFADATQKVMLLNAAIAGISVAGIKMSSDIEAEAIKMQNSLGLPIEEAEKFEDIAKAVYSGGYGDDLAASFDAVIIAQKKFGDNAEIDIGKVTKQAFALQKTFDVDINDSMSAISNLMVNFGLTSNQAMDFLTTGFQEGLNGSEDFIDSINEYSTQFKNGGADAGQFFSVLSTGFSEGILGTDKAADLFKEFRVRIQDGSKSTKEALESIGIDPDAFAQNMASGKLSAIDAFGIVQEELRKTTDSSDQLNNGVALMGTQFEDLGGSIALGISAGSASIEEMAGAINGIDTKTFEQKFTSALRTITTEFGDLKQWETAKDKIADVFEDIALSFGPAMEKVDFSGLEGAVGEIWTKIQNIFLDNDIDVTSIEGMKNAIQLVVNSVETLADVTSGIVDILSPMVSAFIDTIKYFNDMDEDTKSLIGNIMGLGTAFVTLGGIVSIGGSLTIGLSNIVRLFALNGPIVSGLSATRTTALLTFSSLTKLAQIGSIAISFTAGWAVGSWINENTDIGQYFQELFRGVDKVINFTGTMGDVDFEWDKKEIQQTSTEEINKILADAEQYLNPVEPKVEVDVGISLEDAVNDFFGVIDRYESGVIVDIEAKAKTDSIQSAKDALRSITTDDGKTYVVPYEVAPGIAEDAKKEIDKIPTERMLEIKLQGDIDTEIASITSAAQSAQSAFEWSAKVDIVDIESSSKQAISAFDAVGASVANLSQSSSDMFGSLVSGFNDLGTWDQNEFMDILEDQQAAQNKALESQVKLNEAQAQYLKARSDALQSGDSTIKIDSTGLEPALEAFMWHILEKVQVRANATASEFLLGI